LNLENEANVNKSIAPHNTINLPSDYQFHTNFDFNKDKKILYGLQISLFAILGLMIGLSYLLELPMKSSWSTVATILITVGMAGFYLIIHEFTHGAFYYFLSGVKPIYAVKLPYLATGSPVYFNKTSFMIIALAPVVVWGIILTLMLLFLPADFFKSIYIVLAINFAGSSGDIFLSYKLSKLPSKALFQDKTGTDPKVFLSVI